MAVLGARQAALKVAAWAGERTPLYGALYVGRAPVRSWQEFVRLPVLTPERLRATPLVDQLDDPRDTLRMATPLTLASVVTAAPTLLDQEDTDAIFSACHNAFRLAGVTAGMSVVIVAPPGQRYLAAEWCDILGYFGITAHVVIDIDETETRRALTALAPARVVHLGNRPLPAPESRSAEGEAGGRFAADASITVRQPHAQGGDFYVVPEAGIVAVRPVDGEGYLPLRRYVLIEAERDGRLLLTAVLRYHQPLIRFVLPDRGHIAGGRLWLDEVLP